MAINDVMTCYGPVHGVETENYTLFKHIPYAAAPVGKLRFAAPAPHEGWTEMRDCTEWGECAVQKKRPAPGEDPNKVTWIGSEDCLKLDVWTPAKSADEKLPVLFWIHGGGFVNGNSHGGSTDGAYYCKRGVILVSIQFRLGILGFLGLKELAARDEHGATGTYGFMDTIEALKWVKKNISAFGGDPDRVTVFGQSSGGMTIKWLLSCEEARPYYKRGIAMSGGGTWDIDPVMSFEDKCYYTQKALDMLGWSLDDVMSKDVYELCSGLDSVEQKLGIPQKSLATNLFQPSVDNFLVFDYFGVRLYEGYGFDDKDVMCGTIRGESRNFPHQIPGGIGDYGREFAMAPGIAWGRRNIELGKPPIYHYFFDHDLPGEKGYPMHGSEMPYTFHTLERVDRPWEEYDYLMSETAADYWCSFAEKGDPDTEGRPEWPAFTAEHPVSMRFYNNRIAAEDIGNEEKEKVVADFLLEKPGIIDRPFFKD